MFDEDVRDDDSDIGFGAWENEHALVVVRIRDEHFEELQHFVEELGGCHLARLAETEVAIEEHLIVELQ